MSKKILVIDDEELIIKSLKKLLAKIGDYEIFVIKRGQDALIIVEEEDVDLIISDIRMPGENGVEIIKSIYEMFNKQGREKPPVIFITGYADKKIEEEAKALNPVDYIHKPFDINVLTEKVKETLGN